MKPKDLWLDEPINLPCYEDVIHIDSTPNAGYVEDTNGEILFFDEMDDKSIEVVNQIVNNHV